MRRSQRWRALGVFGCFALACAQSEDPDSNLGSETHWLSLCDSDADCGGDGLSCECGVCTLPCSEDAQCSSYEATCSGVGETATTALCGGAAERSAGLCLPSCADGCSVLQSCVGDACIPSAQETPAPEVVSFDAGNVPTPLPGEPELSPDGVPGPSVPDRNDAGTPTNTSLDASASTDPDASAAPPSTSPDGGPRGDASLEAFDAGLADAGTVDAASVDAAMSGVVLRAVLTEVSPGSPGIAAEWTNDTPDPIYLAGCSTVSGWSFDGSEWQEYGAFVLCAVEGPMVVVAPGETYRDIAGDPPNRGLDVWRLVGTYGVGCSPTEGLFSEVACASRNELTSNEVTVEP